MLGPMHVTMILFLILIPLGFYRFWWNFVPWVYRRIRKAFGEGLQSLLTQENDLSIPMLHQ